MCLLQAKLIKGALEAALTKLKAHFQGEPTLSVMLRIPLLVLAV